MIRCGEGNVQYRASRTFVVSNTLRTVRLHPGIDSAPNENAIGDFLLVGFNADPSTTFFREIHRLRPGHSLSLDVGSGHVRESRYWTFPSPQRITYRRDRDYVEHFRLLLDNAVRDRMRMPDVGVFLSGGMDSTTIAAAAKAVCAARAVGAVTAHTSVSTPLAHDREYVFTQLAAAQLNIALRCHPVGGLGPFETRETDRRLTRPEPVDSPNLDIFVGIASALAEDGRVALYGEDGDALLVGYSVRTWIRETPIARIVWEAGRYMLRARRIPHLGLGLKRAVRDPLLRFARVQSEAATESRIPSYIQPAFAERLRLEARYRVLSSDYPGPESHLGRMKARLTAPQWQSLLESLDPGVTGLPLTVALPFLDLRLVSFAAAIPPVPWCQHKELLRASMRGVLPRRIIRRPKVSLADTHYAAKLRQGDERGTIARPPVENTIAYARVMEPQANDTRDPLIRWTDLRVQSLDLWIRQEVVGDSQTEPGGTSDAHGPVETKKTVH